MPNHCESDLTVTGPKAERDRFIAGILEKGEKDKDGSVHYSILHTYMPIPADLNITSPAHTIEEKKQAKANIKKYGHADWYDWANANYGTKWGDYDFVHKVTPRSLKISFSSAWSPPINGLVSVSKQFPELHFQLKYYECGAAYQGVAQIKNGELLSDETSHYGGRRGG